MRRAKKFDGLNLRGGNKDDVLPTTAVEKPSKGFNLGPKEARNFKESLGVTRWVLAVEVERKKNKEANVMEEITRG
ncbi:hypothetical protein FNV43_RR03567 [Rhamnella rubrinervis]|uniref:Uncharacterized protein n=1 Tax=Rhamnella rubrinervis TaxID=2594499 RepID=A0A8K0HI77_9ROSA|nr:hypothetical protein FNV43_RR03567 [Rhamnella rubrinervis]